MRRDVRAFRPVDPMVAAPIWAWGLSIALLVAAATVAALFVALT